MVIAINREIRENSKLGNTWKAIRSSPFYSKTMLSVFPTGQLSLRASHPSEENNSGVMPSSVHHEENDHKAREVV